ncbi:CRTAC1 family protein, partial [Arthrospira platensis SPKY1]|nr:CRTAC1 family protein [Arthrospira platensis SPKY1]
FVDIFCGDNGIILRNNGDMTFTAHSVLPTSGSVGDVNNDGFLDVYNSNNLRINQPNGNHWIKIHLQGVQSNRNGIGARVEIYGAWGKQIRDVRSGDGFRYMSSLNTHFGIGSQTEITQVI